jgi:hypothetical protein
MTPAELFDWLDAVDAPSDVLQAVQNLLDGAREPSGHPLFPDLVDAKLERKALLRAGASSGASRSCSRRWASCPLSTLKECHMTLVIDAEVFCLEPDWDFELAYTANAIFNDNPTIAAVTFRHWLKTVTAHRQGFGQVLLNGITFNF